MIELVTYQPYMYEIIKQWWIDHGVIPIAEEALPATSAVVLNSESKEMIAAAWVYLDNSVGFAALSWPVANPKCKARVKLNAMNQIVQYLSGLVRDFGYTILVGFSSIKSVSRILERNGFQAFDNNITFSVKGLQ